MKKLTKIITLVLTGLMCVSSTGILTNAQNNQVDRLYSELKTPSQDSKTNDRNKL